ncbi:MAG: dimethylarginine dimethylaminohydrolase family protein, partial [Bdellovibrionales bacterium]
VDYAINPYMRDARGHLQTVDSEKAFKQWDELKGVFERLGISVEVMEGDPDFPDMVFCANQTLPYLDPQGRLQVILSRMHSEPRKGEIRHFRAWAEARGITATEMTDFDFEGAGDAIWNYGTREIFGGFGFRTQAAAYDQIQKRCGVNLYRLRLVSEHFYHLDTCFAVLSADTAAYVHEAFDDEAVQILHSKFKKLIRIHEDEARMHFAANCVSVDERHIVLQKGAPRFVQNLRTEGFIPVEVETGEFMKSGGSVFCMKQQLP